MRLGYASVKVQISATKPMLTGSDLLAKVKELVT